MIARLCLGLAVSVALAVALNFMPIDPIKALFWSAVVNGVLAAPVMAVLMILVRREDVMGDLVVAAGYTGWAGPPQLPWVSVSSACW